jgi:ABC-type multidrug transport system fused ATPase/permease subunit
MAADETGATGDQDTHADPYGIFTPGILREAPLGGATMSGTFLHSLGQIAGHLTRRRKRQLFLLLALMLLGAAAELMTLGAVIPFVMVLADPQAAARKPVVSAFMSLFSIPPAQLPVAIGLAFATLVLLAMAVRLAMTYSNIRFANGLGAEIGERLYTLTLQRPYSFHVSRNTSQIIGSMNKIQRLIVGYVQPLLTGTTAIVLSIAIVSLLVSLQPVVALGGATLFGGSYFLVAHTVRRRLRRSGEVIALANDQRIQALQEGLGGIRDVILDRAHAIYSRRFSRIEQRFRKAQATSQFDSTFPRIAVEAIGTLLLVAFTMTLSSRGHDLVAMLPVLGLLAVGAQKLIPLLQQIYAGWSSVLSAQRSVDDVLSLLDFEPLPPTESTIEFDREVWIDNVAFAYGEPPGRPVLAGIDLRIARGEKIGIAGPTGSGKSTLVDLLMGLLIPTSGRFCIDGRPINPANAAAWQAHIAHVPQSIYLSDTTIAENIAFGVESKRIDWPRLEQAANAAQIHDYISGLPAGYHTAVGERGVRLSGGQRQRIGIARALYRGSDLLVLDEATSALDDATERKVMAGIATISRRTTVVMVAHRLTTLRNCDRIVRLENGRIAGVSGYMEMMEEHAASLSSEQADGAHCP